MTDENKIVQFPKRVPADVVFTDDNGTIQHVEYKMDEERQAENRFQRDRRPVTMVEIAKAGSPQEQVKLWNDWMVRNSTYGKGGNTLTIHAVDREKLDRELEKVLGADDDEFAQQTAAIIHGMRSGHSFYGRLGAPAEPLAELDWSIQPPTTPAERKRLIWGSGLVLGGLVVLAIAAIVAGFKLAMG